MKEIDFENDLKSEILNKAKEMGIKVSPNQEVDKILLDYLTVRSKLIDIRKRNILINPDFEEQIEKHPKAKEIKTIIYWARIGKDLNVFQSKRLLQTNFHDHLRTEWNIYHFHLSLEWDKKSGFVKQTNSLLFAYIEQDLIIFLGTETHKDGIFADTKWIEVLHDHFPQTIEKYKDESIIELSPKVNAKERQTLWNKGVVLGFTKIRDTIYQSPGIGRATSGHSIIVTEQVVMIRRWLNTLRKQFEKSKKALCEYIKVPVEIAEFKIKMGNKTLEVHEKTSGYKLLECPEILIEEDEILKRITERG